jgi:ribosomal protein L9
MASRRAASTGTEEQRMLGVVSKDHVAQLVLEQLHIELPPSQILMDGNITQFGHFRVPLNLRSSRGKQVELRLEVHKVRRTR